MFEKALEEALELMAVVLLVMVEQPLGEVVVLMVLKRQEGEIGLFEKMAFLNLEEQVVFCQ